MIQQQRITSIPAFLSVRHRAPAAAAAPSALLTNLVAYWKMDEAAGANNALDAHTGGLTLTHNGSPGSTTGKVGTARTFSAASSQYFKRTSEAALQCGGSSFTIAGWFYWTSIDTSSSLVTKDVDTSREYTLDRADTRVRFYINGGGTVIVNTPASTIAINNWYFVVAWWSAVDSKCRVQVNNGTVYASTGTATPTDGAAEFRVGARAYPGFNDLLSGYIDELGFWKRLLTDDEKTALYNSGNGITYPFAGT